MGFSTVWLAKESAHEPELLFAKVSTAIASVYDTSRKLIRLVRMARAEKPQVLSIHRKP